jgi:predicted MFS family arabinose efflux permease
VPDQAVASRSATDRPFSWRFTTPLFLGSALNPVNSSLIATALVPIARGLDVPIGRTATLVSALYLASAIAQPTAGKAAEVLGPRRVFLTGIGLVLVGGLVGGFAPNLLTLLISRVLIGLGTSCAYPTAMVLVGRRAKAAGMVKAPGSVLGGLQIAGIATASLGLPLGGLLVQFLGWRSVFFINIPVALIALFATLMWVPKDDAIPAASERAPLHSLLDLPGILGFALAMTTLLLFLNSLPSPTWWFLAVSVVLWITDLAWELRAKTPFLDIRLLTHNAALSRIYARFGLAMLCSYVVMYGITQWLEATRGLSEATTGLLLLPMTLVSGLVIPPISSRNLVRGPVIVAAFACLVGSGLVLLLHTDAWLAVTIALTVVFGIAMGTSASANQIALYQESPADQLGTAAGLLRSFGYLGSIASSAITGIVFHHSVSNAGVNTIGWIMIGVSLLLIALSVTGTTARHTAAVEA